MADTTAMRICLLAYALAMLAGCGQKGPLYLPEAPGEVVTRPAAPPPESEVTTAPNSPQTVDSPQEGSTPAPEVTAPAGTPEADDPKKQKSATPPPPK
jgi:predicted small lipoprotein YifL